MIERILRLIYNYDLFYDVIWDYDLQFSLNCNDVFYWGCGDAEGLDDVDLLEMCLGICKNTDTAIMLYCAIRRRMRPQGAIYTSIPKEEWYLFNGCGAEREITVANPYKPGEYDDRTL